MAHNGIKYIKDTERLLASEWLKVLRCPATGARLLLDGKTLKTEDQTRCYPTVDDIPILIADELSVFSASDFTALVTKRSPQRHRSLLFSALETWWPRDSRNVTVRRNLEVFRRLLAAMPTQHPRRRLLVIGGAVLGEGARALIEDPQFNVLETDVYIGPRTQLICDGHNLPFVDEAFDGVLCQAVLEHVVDPPRVAKEIHRVLVPEGIVYSEIPFMQGVHQGAYDFTRYTLVGHRRLHRRFDELGSGISCGPGMALAWAFRYWLRSIVPQQKYSVAFANRIARLVTFWLPRLDRFLVGRPTAEDGASGTWFMGRRRRLSRTDREIVRTYDGTGISPAEPHHA